MNTHNPIPTFLFIGGQRCGSSWIHKCLQEHPEVFTAEPKELHFFNRHFDRGSQWYLEHFTPSPEHSAWGEVTPDYIADPECPERIKALCPDAVIIAVLRDPVERAHSIYQLKRNTSLDYPTFEEALKNAPDIIEHGKYAQHLERWYEHFDRDRVLVLLYDDLVRDEEAIIERIYTHIGVDDTYKPSWLGQTYNAVIMPGLRDKLRRIGLEPLVRLIRNTPIGDAIRKANRRAKSKKSRGSDIKPETRASLSETYKAHNERLAQMLDADLSSWS